MKRSNLIPEFAFWIALAAVFLSGVYMLQPHSDHYLIYPTLHCLFLYLSFIIIRFSGLQYGTGVARALYHFIIVSLLSVSITYLLHIFNVRYYYIEHSFKDMFPGFPWILWLVNFLVLVWQADITAAKFTIEKNSLEQQRVEASVLMVKEAELFKLRQQIQPHFLFNALNSINALIQINAERASEMVASLSDLLRMNLKKESSVWVPLAEELNYLKLYLTIEKIRFGDRLNIDMNIDQDPELQVPPFLLQPLLENAIKYGLKGDTEKVFINFSVQKMLDNYKITITNTIDATQSRNKSPGTGFGINGIRRRLELLYNRSDLLRTEIKDDTFIANLYIPNRHDKNIDHR